MGVTQNSYIPRAWEVSDLKVSGANRPQGLIYSFGEEGMQLVQPSKFFSDTIFRTHSIGSIGMRARELRLCCYF